MDRHRPLVDVGLLGVAWVGQALAPMVAGRPLSSGGGIWQCRSGCNWVLFRSLRGRLGAFPAPGCASVKWLHGAHVFFLFRWAANCSVAPQRVHCLTHLAVMAVMRGSEPCHTVCPVNHPVCLWSRVNIWAAVGHVGLALGVPLSVVLQPQPRRVGAELGDQQCVASCNGRRPGIASHCDFPLTLCCLYRAYHVTCFHDLKTGSQCWLVPAVHNFFAYRRISSVSRHQGRSMRGATGNAECLAATS